jgi:hypothetical protein
VGLEEIPAVVTRRPNAPALAQRRQRYLGGAGHRHQQSRSRSAVLIKKGFGATLNLHARSLKGGVSKVIGGIAASKANQYYATLVSAFETAVEPSGYSCFVADAAANGVYLLEREDRIVTLMIQQRVAAVVLTCAITARNLELMKAWQIPVLFVDCLPPETDATYPCVTSDNFAPILQGPSRSPSSPPRTTPVSQPCLANRKAVRARCPAISPKPKY